jgi:hypothetical protein
MNGRLHGEKECIYLDCLKALFRWSIGVVFVKIPYYRIFNNIFANAIEIITISHNVFVIITLSGEIVYISFFGIHA